ncbi:hypothetical protein BB560_002843 [Smittium megazygosporum]|uniref:Ubiquitin-conjugating enzyme E2C-binding protein n=1 Tax=Smittium megazygosporum TaxID=133381 RepID=A0A2T9ZDS8_9FUNG|nr:hypothetical protein BB560_002843 [Smittium megazygosporum]
MDVPFCSQAFWGKGNIPVIYSETLPNLGLINIYVTLPDFWEPVSSRFTFKVHPVLNSFILGYQTLGPSIIWTAPINLENQLNNQTLKSASISKSISSLNETMFLVLKIKPTPIGESKPVADIMSMLHDPQTFCSSGFIKNLDSLSSIHCKTCFSQLSVPQDTSNLKFWKCVQLPTEYWEELVEFWICHPEGDQLSASISRLNSYRTTAKAPSSSDRSHSEEIQNASSVSTKIPGNHYETSHQCQKNTDRIPHIAPRTTEKEYSSTLSNIIRVGGSYILMEQSSFIPPSYTFSSSSNPQNQISEHLNEYPSQQSEIFLKCSNCGSNLGTVSTLGYEDTQTYTYVFRILLHKIIFQLNHPNLLQSSNESRKSVKNINLHISNKDLGLFVNVNNQQSIGLGRVVVTSILTRISAHATYFFIIHNLDSKSPVLLIKVVSWGVNIQTNILDNSCFEFFKNGIRVWYHEAKNVPSEEFSLLLKSWYQLGAETLSFDDPDCNTISSSLNLHHSFLNQFMSNPTNAKVSFLFPNF